MNNKQEYTRSILPDILEEPPTEDEIIEEEQVQKEIERMKKEDERIKRRIEKNKEKIFDEAVTLCHKHHLKLHSIYGKKPKLIHAEKMKNWVEKQRIKYGLV